MNQTPINVCISGAAGQIGYALLFRIASGQMFGTRKVNLRLLELTQALPACEGVRMELHDCAFPLVHSIEVTDDPHVGFADVDWALLVGSVPRKAGMERKDLLQINSGVFISQGQAINEVARSSAKVFVVGNPCNTNAWIAKEHAPNLNPNHFYAMTMLDENRARHQLAQKASVPVSVVENCIIWGNHSATQFPDYFHARIDNNPAVDVIDDALWLQETFIPVVQKRGAVVIQARGASSAASAASAIVDSVAKIHGGCDQPFSLCVSSQGQYGVPEGLIFSMPCVAAKNGVVSVKNDWQHSDAFAQSAFQATLHELLEERDAVC